MEVFTPPTLYRVLIKTHRRQIARVPGERGEINKRHILCNVAEEIRVCPKKIREAIRGSSNRARNNNAVTIAIRGVDGCCQRLGARTYCSDAVRKQRLAHVPLADGVYSDILSEYSIIVFIPPRLPANLESHRAAWR